MSFFFRRFFSSSSPATMEAAQQKAQQLIDENAVMVFSKSYCPYCNNTKRILNGLDAKYKAIELNQESDGDEIQSALAKITGQRTVPNIFIGQKHIGGNSDLEALGNKKLEALLKEAGAL
ncbi:thioredoxin-like protein [Podospora australis]|uniref:Thioredoxin-like protein n=1 Tax=Podospora australis TaxID=1536484 RepID=A0AAN6X147_9PEZI|nr:thioredoxin-like protein [Podospora australis]